MRTPTYPIITIPRSALPAMASMLLRLPFCNFHKRSPWLKFLWIVLSLLTLNSRAPVSYCGLLGIYWSMPVFGRCRMVLWAWRSAGGWIWWWREAGGEECLWILYNPDWGKHGNYYWSPYCHGSRLRNKYDHFRIHNCPRSYCHVCSQSKRTPLL